MNYNDILNELHKNSESCEPSDRINPDSVENLLSGVKRKSNKGVVSACVTLCVACFLMTGVFATVIYKNMARPELPIKTGGEVSSYDDIYNVVNSVRKANEPSIVDRITEEFIDTRDAMEMSDIGAESFAYTSGSSGTDYSETNIQVEGIDEGDVVKTDGEYIYSMSYHGVSISMAQESSTPKAVSSIDIPYPVCDLYIYEDKIAVVADDTMTSDWNTVVLTYDLTDIENPELISTLTQQGYYISSRRIDNILYLTTSYSVNDLEKIDKNKPETYCPSYGVDGNYSCVDFDSIYVSEMVEYVEYVTASSIDLNVADDFADICSVLGAGSDMYMSHSNLYITTPCIEENSNATQIMRFSVNGTGITENGSVTVDGYILNQFAMDEYDGYFRVVTETTPVYTYDEYTTADNTGMHTTLYVFDDELNIVGKTEDVANGESVKSVRFDEDTAYFVTFRQTDPLFTVDLSDPASPEILSELKIPGFSEYLHIFGDGLLLGFGREADPYTGVTEGLKLTMFDVSDKTNVKEIATRVFTSSEVYSEAEYDHRAVFVDEEKGIIGIPYISYSNGEEVSSYSIFEYDEEVNDFILIKDIELSDLSYARGLYIGEYFYIVTQDSIYTFDYKTFEQITL